MIDKCEKFFKNKYSRNKFDQLNLKKIIINRLEIAIREEKRKLIRKEHRIEKIYTLRETINNLSVEDILSYRNINEIQSLFILPNKIIK